MSSSTVVIVGAKRTPIGSFNGAFAALTSPNLGATAIRAALARQASCPVRWVETVQAFAARGVTRAFECGPGRVLTGLGKRIAPAIEGQALDDGDAIAAALAALAGDATGER